MNGNSSMKKFINKYLGKIVGSYFLILCTFSLVFILWVFILFTRGINYSDVILFAGVFLIDFIVIYFICKKNFKDTFIVYGISFVFFLIDMFLKFYRYIGF